MLRTVKLQLLRHNVQTSFIVFKALYCMGYKPFQVTALWALGGSTSCPMTVGKLHKRGNTSLADLKLWAKLLPVHVQLQFILSKNGGKKENREEVLPVRISS